MIVILRSAKRTKEAEKKGRKRREKKIRKKTPKKEENVITIYTVVLTRKSVTIEMKA